MIKSLFLLLLISLSFTIDFPDIYIHSKIGSLINTLKTKVPDFIEDIREEIDNFKEMSYEAQDKLLKGLNNTIKGVIESIKEGKDNLNQHIKEFIEKGTKIAGLLTGRDCGALDYIPFVECTDISKYILSHIFGTIKEEFKCSKIINLITTNLISKDLVYNLKSMLFFVISLSSNPEIAFEGTAQILYDITNCFGEKFNSYWPKIEEFLKIDKLSTEVKKDILYMMMYSLSNLIEVVRSEEKDGFLTKLNGLINNDLAKKLQKNIFNFSKKFLEFGTGFYNISSSLAFNMTINPGGLGLTTDGEILFSNINNKGIKLILHSNYLFRIKGAYAIHTIIFESPLVSLRGKKEIENGVSNVFVGITLYDREGNEIFVKDINLEDFKPQILFDKKIYNPMTTCLFYDEENNKLDDDGIKTDNNYILDGQSYIRCIPSHLTVFTIGTSEVSLIDKRKIIIYTTIIAIILKLIIAYICIRKNCCKKISNYGIEKISTNKKNYIELDEEDKNKNL